jgi:hypothetical protein
LNGLLSLTFNWSVLAKSVVVFLGVLPVISLIAFLNASRLFSGTTFFKNSSSNAQFSFKSFSILVFSIQVYLAIALAISLITVGTPIASAAIAIA